MALAFEDVTDISQLLWRPCYWAECQPALAGRPVRWRRVIGKQLLAIYNYTYPRVSMEY